MRRRFLDPDPLRPLVEHQPEPEQETVDVTRRRFEPAFEMNNGKCDRRFFDWFKAHSLRGGDVAVFHDKSNENPEDNGFVVMTKGNFVALVNQGKF